MNRPGDIQRDPEAPTRTRRALDSISNILNSLIRSGQIAFDGATDQFMIVPDRRSVVPPVPPIYDDAPDVIIVPGPAGPAGPQGATGPAGSGGGGSGGAQLYFPDLPPASANANDDEFSTGSLGAAWTEWDVGSQQTVAVGTYGLALTQTGTSGNSWAGVHRAVPAGDWSLVTRLSLAGIGDSFNGAAIILAEDIATNPSTGDIRTFGITYQTTNSLHLTIYRFSDYQTFSSTALDTTLAGHEYLYLRVRRATTTLFYDYSTDGLNWVQAYTESEPFTVSRVGLAADNSSNAGQPASTSYFRFWRQTSSTALAQPLLGAFSGTAGAAGIQGMPGVQGEEGEPGMFVPGLRGADGVAGAQGIQGVTGPPGLQGEDAPDIVVFPGPQGVQGATGPVGPTGATGGGLAAAAIIYPDESDPYVPPAPAVNDPTNTPGYLFGSTLVLTTEATTSTTPVDLATPQSVTFTLTRSTTVVIECYATAYNSAAATNFNVLSVEVDGTDFTVGSNLSATALQSTGVVGNLEQTLAAGSHTIKYQFFVTAGTGSFLGRLMKVTKK